MIAVLSNIKTHRVDWKSISATLSPRTPRQCFDRNLYLQREKEVVQRHVWTDQETATFIKVTSGSTVQWKEV